MLLQNHVSQTMCNREPQAVVYLASLKVVALKLLCIYSFPTIPGTLQHNFTAVDASTCHEVTFNLHVMCGPTGLSWLPVSAGLLRDFHRERQDEPLPAARAGDFLQPPAA